MLWVGNGQIVRVLTTFGTIAILARFLGPEDFGVISGVVMVALIANFVGDFGLGAAVIQRPEVDDKLLSCVFWLNITIASLLALLVAVTSEQISALFQLPEMTEPLRVGSLIFPLTAIRGAWRAILEKSLQFRKVALAEMFGTIAGSLAAIVSVLLGADIWSLVIQQLVLAGGASFAFMVAARWKPMFFFSYSMSRPILGFGAHLTFSLLVGLLAKFIDRPIISRNLGAEALGHYSVAVQLVDYPARNLAQVLQRIMFPALSMVQSDNARLRHMHRTALHGVTLIIWPIMVGLSAVSDLFVTVLMGPNWELTAVVLSLIAPAGAIGAINGVNNTLFLAKRRPDLQLYTTSVLAAAMIAGLLIGVQYGLKGVAIAHLASVIVVWPAMIILSFRQIEQPVLPTLRFIAPIIFSSGLMYAAVVYLKTLLSFGPIIELSICIPAGVVVFVAAEVLLDRKQLKVVLSSLARPSAGATITPPPRSDEV